MDKPKMLVLLIDSGALQERKVQLGGGYGGGRGAKAPAMGETVARKAAAATGFTHRSRTVRLVGLVRQEKR